MNFSDSEAEELTRARYRAAKERILKMSIYDQRSLTDVQLMINQFFYLSGKIVTWCHRGLELDIGRSLMIEFSARKLKGTLTTKIFGGLTKRIH